MLRQVDSDLSFGSPSCRMKQGVRIAVVGAGVVGLSSAVCIAEALPLCSITLLADRFSPDTTSDGAAGILFAAKFPGAAPSAFHFEFCMRND